MRLASYLVLAVLATLAAAQAAEVRAYLKKNGEFIQAHPRLDKKSHKPKTRGVK